MSKKKTITYLVINFSFSYKTEMEDIQYWKILNGNISDIGVIPVILACYQIIISEIFL